MDQHWIYLNEETLRSHKDNKWFQLLNIIPQATIRAANDVIDKIRFALINEETLDNKAKKDIYRYILSNAINDWCARKESKHMQVFDCPDIFKQTKKIKQTTMTQIKSICKKEAKEQFEEWNKRIKRLNKLEYQRLSREAVAQKEFLNSALYKFIQSLTEDDHGRITSRNLYERYQKFCEDNKLTPTTHDKMAKDLNKHSILAIEFSHKQCYILTQSNINQFLNYYNTQDVNEIISEDQATNQAVIQDDDECKNNYNSNTDREDQATNQATSQAVNQDDECKNDYVNLKEDSSDHDYDSDSDTDSEDERMKSKQIQIVFTTKEIENTLNKINGYQKILNDLYQQNADTNLSFDESINGPMTETERYTYNRLSGMIQEKISDEQEKIMYATRYLKQCKDQLTSLNM